MNNEQNNNSIFDIPNQNNNPTNTNNITNPINTIPGANLTPTDNGVSPVSTTPVSETPVIPSIVTPEVTNTEPLPTNNPEQSMGSSPFDIGVGNNTTVNQPINQNLEMPNNNINIASEISPANNNVPNMQTPPMNNTPINNNISQNTAPVNNQLQDNVVSIGKYIVHLLLCCIPLVGIIILFIRAFSKDENKNLSNLAKAQLIMMGISAALSIIVFIIITAIAASAVGSVISNPMY